MSMLSLLTQLLPCAVDERSAAAGDRQGVAVAHALLWAQGRHSGRTAGARMEGASSCPDRMSPPAAGVQSGQAGVQLGSTAASGSGRAAVLAHKQLCCTRRQAMSSTCSAQPSAALAHALLWRRGVTAGVQMDGASQQACTRSGRPRVLADCRCQQQVCRVAKLVFSWAAQLHLVQGELQCARAAVLHQASGDQQHM